MTRHSWFQNAYDCTQPWNPTNLDERVALAKAEDAVPLVIVDYTPTCMATGMVPGDNPNDYPPDPAKWVGLVTQMAAHEIGAGGVTMFEVTRLRRGPSDAGGVGGATDL